MASAREVLAEPDANTAKAAEWLLDNDYLVQRTATQLGEHLPEGFTSLLPALAGGHPPEGPRVWAVARGLLQASGLQITLSATTRFVDAYQRHAPLTIAEVWAFPTMLRLVCLELLTTALARLVPDLEAAFRPGRLHGQSRARRHRMRCPRAGQPRGDRVHPVEGLLRPDRPRRSDFERRSGRGVRADGFRHARPLPESRRGARAP